MDDLYPDGYIIEEETVEIVDSGVAHSVTELHAFNGEEYSLDGYFLEIPSQETAYYIDRNGDYITLYNPDSTSDTFDLRFDEDYDELGFSPYQSDGNVGGKKFWGKDDCYEYTIYDQCYKRCRYRIFWIGVSWTNEPCD